MRIRRSGLLVLGLLLLPTTVRATGHNADAGVGASLAGGSTLVGFQESLAITLPEHTFSILGDFGVHLGSHQGNDLTRLTFMGGVRWTLPRTANQLSAYAMLGGVHSSGPAENGTGLASALGLAYDPPLFHGSPSEGGWGLRFQLDRVFRNGNPDDFTRAAIGIVHRFKTH